MPLVIGSLLMCVGLSAPLGTSPEVVEPYAPLGRYAGHWGVDLAAPPGSTVRATAPGTISFSGMVVGNSTVTIDHGGGLRTSYSYLSVRLVQSGTRVRRGQTVGLSGRAHGQEVLHFSVRVAGRYRDPMGFLVCPSSFPERALWLAPGSSVRLAYASRRESGHLGRNLRSSPLGSSRGRRSRISTAGA